MTTRLPDSPKTLSSIMARTASSASCRVMHTRAPLPRARPSAFTTMGMGAAAR